MARDELLGMIRDGRLAAGTTLLHRGRRDHSRDATATVVAGGLRMKGKVYPTPSAAARAVANKPVDGWLFWRLPGGEPLGSLRPGRGALASVTALAGGQPVMETAVGRSLGFPRMRYMGSKYKVVPALLDILDGLEFDSALDAFSGSGVVGYALKAMGKKVVANDFLTFSATIADATIANSSEVLTSADLELLTSESADGRDFIATTFKGLYFPHEDLAFLDSAWSHIASMTGHRRSLAIAGLCLAAARKQPRGVFTISDFRYDDGRRQLHTPLRELFLEAAAEFNACVFDSGRDCRATCQEVFDIDPADFELVYLDPPYAPPSDDNCYIKRYHFLEGLSVYWEGRQIMENTKTKKLQKRYTPFSYRSTIRDALTMTFRRFTGSTIVLSYSSNSVPGQDEVISLLREVKGSVEVHTIPHRYSFGTHAAAQRREAHEYIFIAR